MVRTVQRPTLHFLAKLSMRCKLQPKLPCAGCTQTRVHTLYSFIVQAAPRQGCTHSTASLCRLHPDKGAHTLQLHRLLKHVQCSANWTRPMWSQLRIVSAHLPSIWGQKPLQWTLGQCQHSHLFISLYLLGPTDNADPPTTPQMRQFPPKREAENIHAVSHTSLSQLFPFP